MSQQPPANQQVLQLLWDYFIEHDEFPTRKWFAIQLHDQKIEFDPLRSPALGVWGYGSGLDGRVQLSFEGALTIKEGRELMRPLPAVLRLAAARFIEHPGFRLSHDHARVRFAEFASFWADERDAKRAAHILALGGLRYLSFGGSIGPSLKDAFFEPSIEAICYANVQSLEDVETLVRDDRATAVGNFPFGRHLKLLDAVFAHVIECHKWPTPLPFAVRHRELGYIPRLVNDLAPRFIKREFDDTEYSELELSAAALPILDREGVVQERIVRIARALGPLWREREDGQISEGDLLRATGLTHAEAAPALLFMVDDNLFSSHSINGKAPPGQWNFTLRDEGALYLEQIENYDKYRTALENLPERRYAAAFLSKGVPPEPVPFKAELTEDLKTHLSFMQDPSLRSIALADLVELKVALDGGANKMALALLGSFLEALLTDTLSNNVTLAKTYIREFPNARLEDLIRAATRIGLVSGDITPLMADFVRNQRNLIHPERFRSSQLQLSPVRVQVAVAATQNIVEDLERAASDGRLAAFQKGLRALESR